jgi:hypothetical protein
MNGGLCAVFPPRAPCRHLRIAFGAVATDDDDPACADTYTALLEKAT